MTGVLPLAKERSQRSIPPAVRHSSGATGRPTRRQAITIGCAGAAGIGIAAWLVGVSLPRLSEPWWAFFVAESVGLSFMAAGLVAWWLRPTNRMGPLMVFGGCCWYLTNLQDVGNPVLFALGYWLSYLDLVVYGHLALAYPNGRVTPRFDRWVVCAGYGAYLVLQGCRYLAEGAGQPIGLHPSSLTAWADVLSVTGLVLNAFVSGIIIHRWRRASRPARQVHSPVWFMILYMCTVLTAGAIGSLVDTGATGRRLALVAYALGLLGTPFAVLSGLLRIRLAHVRVADLVVALEQAADPTRLQHLLAVALDDPSLVLGFWSNDNAGYVDAAGRPVSLPRAGGAQTATFVGEDTQRLAILVHARALAAQRSVVDAVVATARLALENARLQALLQAQLVELHASRRRIAQAAVDERRKIERDLHDGVQQRLLRVSWLAKRVSTSAVADGVATEAIRVLDELAEEARCAHTELRELARGIHPSMVTERGLAAAIEEYALRAPVAVVADIQPERWPPTVEVTAFFLISEAVVNAAKHAGVNQVWVRARQRRNRLRVEVRDHGVGGAQPRHGSGLRGMRDRVNALGGTLVVRSQPGQGTRIIAELPCA
jgi:signal transduction histidine kinase